MEHPPTGPDLPANPESPSGWMGAELADAPDRWTRRWTDGQLDDLLTVARPVVRDGLVDIDAAAASDADVPAAPPSLLELAEGIRSDLQHGLGFTVLSGFPVAELDRATIAAALVLLGRLVGRPRPQNAAGHLLGHVKDVGRDPDDPDARIYQTNGRQHFHTDSADAVALLCLRPALSGGRSQLASAMTAYRIMRERHPDLWPWLFEPVATDRRGEVPDGLDPWFEIPVLSWFDGQLTVQYQRAYIESAQRFPGAPRLASGHAEALDRWDAILEEPDVRLTMDLAPGDIQFVYNHARLHDRTAFVDDPDPGRRRHLLRLWLALPGDRTLPPVFAQRYGSVAVGERGGVHVGETPTVIPLDVL